MSILPLAPSCLRSASCHGARLADRAPALAIFSSCLRGLRGTAFDVFGRSADRKLERELIADYEKDVASALDSLSPVTFETAVELLGLPDRIRGYGPVKEKSVKDAKARHTQLTADLVNPPTAPRQIAAE